MKNRKRLYTLIISIIVLMGFLATSLIGYFVARSSISQRLQQEMLPLTSDNIYSEIQRDLLHPLVISSLMANDVFVFDWVNEGELEPEKMQSYLSQIQEKYNTITAFFVSSKTQNYYHPTGILKKVSEDVEADAWYYKAKNANQPYLINIDRDTAEPNRLSIFVNYRVLDKKGKFIGVIGVGLSLLVVEELIENYQQRYGREIYFIDRQGQVMLQSSKYSKELHIQNKEGLDKVFTRILTTPSSSFSFNTVNGSTIYLNSRLVPEFDWYLIVEQVNDPSTEKVENALILNLMVSFAISLIVLFILHLASRGYQGRLETMATKDKLTGAINRQVFDSFFTQAVARGKRHQEALSLVLIDIDHFKQVNDNHGHQYGDYVLTAVAGIMRQQVREEDVVCRWGGEEFVLMLQDCNQNQAIKLANNIREAIAQHVFEYNGKKRQITVSAGVAEYQQQETMSQLIARADVSLYQAKNNGRNCVR
ncbi:MAG: diguanylate cyclase [Methylophaga sp.]|uniref:sensor domain-containing diguanylate cyclase n=1 Tax=unclassified Methylophaga TaxID=2629249 RepID=UPI000C672E8F|nr:sensor domain-containing diguanylate cyclase [Methylophaga sp. UBA678]MAX50921.1 diguanylate cyclase [Methylophaga sp.]